MLGYLRILIQPELNALYIVTISGSFYGNLWSWFITDGHLIGQ
jgi:hypothetical protein